eukprot:365694-Chlamydomonas_euryale.AAC.14
MHGCATSVGAKAQVWQWCGGTRPWSGTVKEHVWGMPTHARLGWERCERTRLGDAHPCTPGVGTQ